MAEKSFPLNNTDYGAEDAQLFFATRTRGVFAGDHLAVTPGNGMSVILGEGIAYLKNGKFGGLVYANTEPLTLPISTANATYPRIDRVMVRFDVQENKVFAYMKEGTPSSKPVPPDVEQNTLSDEISPAYVYVDAATTSISAGNITDERLNEEVCGLMRDGVTGIDTSVIYAQWQELTAKLEGLLDEQVAGNLQMQITANAEEISKKSRVYKRYINIDPTFSSTGTSGVYEYNFSNSAITPQTIITVSPIDDAAEVSKFFAAGVVVGAPGYGSVKLYSKKANAGSMYINMYNGVFPSA